MIGESIIAVEKRSSKSEIAVRLVNLLEATDVRQQMLPKIDGTKTMLLERHTMMQIRFINAVARSRFRSSLASLSVLQNRADHLAMVDFQTFAAGNLQSP